MKKLYDRMEYHNLGVHLIRVYIISLKEYHFFKRKSKAFGY
ncbi:putative lipopolysaccharide biosynthesis protein [Helicobacter pylori Shi169]|uniref:Putative lipopolysaccharide biosynthesis protein n=1 Tax=Helicobacter pylori Shi169 TaxID=1163741 RepID=A0A0E0WDB5_HELPX|nr:putative lipopolysaccharide biosynthesis protein [Helicobacter pylori Shi169]